MATWLDDGAGHISAEAGSPSFTVAAGKSGGTPANALYDRPLASGEYFAVDVQALERGGGAFVGLTTKASYGQGYKCKGLFFGRNLSDGSALVRGGFGEEVVQGQRIGVLAEFDDKSVSVTFWQGDRCLGHAFQAARESTEAIYPVVHASAAGSAFEISFPGAAPPARTRQPLPTTHSCEGFWALQDLSVGADMAAVPVSERMGAKGKLVSLRVQRSGAAEAGEAASFRLSTRVCNTVSCSGTASPDPSLEAPFERLALGPAMSTRMMGPAGAMEVERALTDAFGRVDRWAVLPDGSLRMEGAEAAATFAPAAEDCESEGPATNQVLK